MAGGERRNNPKAGNDTETGVSVNGSAKRAWVVNV
jgi:hypothetical protein